MFLLDTNVISELRRTQRCDPNVHAWVSRQPNATLYVSALTLMELEIGVLRIERRDAPQGAALRSWLEDQVRPGFQGRVLSVDEAEASRCAQLHAPDSRPERDALIAATALVHGMTLATRNVADFQMPGIRVINPWEYVRPISGISRRP
jgi:predicted nucleic acid-binding protein